VWWRHTHRQHSAFLSRVSFFLAQAVSRGWRKWQYFVVVWWRSFVAGVCVCVWWRVSGGGVSRRVCVVATARSRKQKTRFSRKPPEVRILNDDPV
jgi:hypothetical protein